MFPASRLCSAGCDPKARPSFLHRERGQALVELALALPVLLAVVGAIIDGGWAFHQAGLVSAAAEAAQRTVAGQDAGSGHCSGAPPSAYVDVARSAARASAPGLDPARLAVALQYLEPACSGRMRTLAVSVSYPVTALTPWFAPLLSGVRLAAQAATAVEEMPPPWWGQAGAVQAQQAQIASLTTAYGQAAAALEAQQGQFASLTAAYGQATSELQAQQAQIASLTAAYGQATSELQAQQAQIVSLTAAYGQATSELQAQQAQIVSLTATYGQATSELQAQQAQIASLTTAYGQAAAALEAQQGRVASLAAAYGQATAELQAQQDQIASLTAAYQTEAAQAASLSGTASYYYSQWQNASAAISALSQAASYYYGQWQSALQWAVALESQSEGQGHEGSPE